MKKKLEREREERSDKLKKAIEKLKPENLRYRQIDAWQDDELEDLQLVVDGAERLVEMREVLIKGCSTCKDLIESEFKYLLLKLFAE